MFISQIEYSKCQSCKGDIYPIYHGNYFSYLNSSISYDDYTYCHLDDIELVSMNLYSNLDILFTYDSKIINNPITEVVVPQNYYSVVRIDNTIGKTIWAKEIVYYPENFFFSISKTILVNDIAWSLFIYVLGDLNTPGVITKLNGDGNLIDIFYAPFSINISPYGSYLFQPYNFFVFSDSSFIITTRCTYNQGEFGVSENSTIDFCFFKIDSNKKFQWSSSIDLMNFIEENQSFYEYNNTLYVAFVSSKFYYCLSILNKDSGEFQNISIFNSTNPQCYYLKKLQGETSQRSLYITFISDNAVYAYGHSYYDPTIINFSLYLFNPKTLKMIKALNMDTGCKIYRGYRSFELNRDIMFCTNSVSMNKIYFNETLDHILEYYSFNFNITSSIYANYYIKETKDGNFFMTIEQDYNYGNYGESKREVMTFKFDSNLNTNSCLNLTQKSTDDYLFNLPIGANASSGLSIYYVNIVSNIFITNSSSLYSKTSSVSDYYIADVTNCIWPRFIPNLCDCAFPLPSFILLSSYNIHIGKAFQTNSVFIPFDHCQNARFVIHAINANDNQIPVWLTVDQSSQSIIFNMSLINSVGIYNISMNARLITFSINSTDTSVYTTQNNTSRFNFYNTNCYFVNSNTTYYLVFEQTSNFQFLFFDEEGDDIIIQASQNDYIGIFVQNINNSNQYKMLLQANSLLNESTTLFIQYTDSYHQDAYFMKNMTLEFYLFKVDPPYFSSVPPVVNATRCSNLLIILPLIKDPNGLNCFVSIDSTSPEWVNLYDNKTLLLKTANLSYSISDTTLISLKISNEKNAWRMYNLTIKTEHYSSPSFGIVNNIIAHFNITTETRIDVNSNIELQVVDCKSNETIPWIKYLQQNLTLQIKPSNISLKIQCAKLASIDSCQNRVYSAQFLVTFIQSSGPPIIGNTFGPLNVYKGESKLFIIPEDLFISDQQHTLNYTSSVLSCSIKSILYTNVTKSNFDSKSYLYILSKDAKTCLVTISATDSNNQSAETTVQINVLNCASKDCLECKSQYQADCVKCKENYKLGAYGACYWNTTFFPDSFGSLFDICGLIILISLIVSLMLSIIIGMRSLYTLEFSHTIIIYVASSSNQSLIKLILWFQTLKLDFGFLDQFHIRNLLFCQIGSDEMSKIQFYCQSTILNYFYLIIILLTLVCCLQILKIVSSRFKLATKVLSFIQNKSNENIVWIVCHLFFSFFCVNLLSDALNIYNHTILSLMSLSLFLVIIIFILIKYPKVITLSFIKKIDHSKSPILTLFTILKSMCNAFLFHFRDHEVRRILLTIGILLHIPFIFVNFIENKEISLLDLYSTKMRGVKNSMFLAILITIGIDDLLQMQISNPQTLALMIAFFFVFCNIIDLGAVFTKFAK